MVLTPTVLGRPESVVTGKARQFRVFRPHIFFVETLALGSPGESFHRRPQLNRLAGGPFADSNPSGIFSGFARGRLARDLPMARHYCGKGVQLEVQIRMAWGNHLVIDE